VRLVGFPWICPVIHPAGLIGSGYLKIFKIKRITGLGYFIKNNKITKSWNSRSGKCEGSAGGIDGLKNRSGKWEGPAGGIDGLKNRSGKCEGPVGGIDGLKNRSGKCKGPAGGARRVKEPEWEMPRTGRGGSTG
jgi:hypothetical protein